MNEVESLFTEPNNTRVVTTKSPSRHNYTRTRITEAAKHDNKIQMNLSGGYVILTPEETTVGDTVTTSITTVVLVGEDRVGRGGGVGVGVGVGVEVMDVVVELWEVADVSEVEVL